MKKPIQKLSVLLSVLLCVLLVVPAYAQGETTADGKVWNILLMGTDERSEEGYGRSDTMIIASIDLKANTVKLTSIMRDTWVNLGKHGDQKINAAIRFGGPELAMQTVNANFGTDISDYVLVDMQGFVSVINAVGGIDIDITQQEMKDINSQLRWDAMDFKLQSDARLDSYGANIHLNGNQALAYARQRHSDSDYARSERQRKVFTAAVEKLRALDAISLIATATAMFGYVETNLQLDECLSVGTSILVTGLDGMEQFRIPVDGTFKSGTYSGVWCIKPDFAKNAELLQGFINGTYVPEPAAE